MNYYYTGEWYGYQDDLTGQAFIRYRLSVYNVDATAWTTDGLSGYWIGIGLGAYTMAGGADMTSCLYSHISIEDPNEMYCIDSIGIEQRRPKPDTIQDSMFVDSTVTFKNESTKLLCNITVTFDKAYQTGDTTQDYKLTPGSGVDGIWAQGQVSKGLQSYHGSTGSSRGAFRLDVPDIGDSGYSDWETESGAQRSY